MTDLEISEALALAIGWTTQDMSRAAPARGLVYINNPCKRKRGECWWSEFDYRDWSVIGPIAERYDCFPYKNCSGLWDVYSSSAEATETPQEAIALAVIGLAENAK